MRSCLTCPLRAYCRRTPAELTAGLTEFFLGEDPALIAERVLHCLDPIEIKQIGLAAMIEVDPEVDLRSIAKAELIQAIEAGDWDEREALR